MLNKIHLKRNVTDRLALCGIWPGHRFVLMAALPRQSGGAVCQACTWAAAATAALAQKARLIKGFQSPLPKIATP